MPPRTKKDEEAAVVVGPGPAPAHASDVCSECGVHPLDPTTTMFTCEHGTTIFIPASPDAEPELTAEEARAAVLAGMSDEELMAALEARTAKTAE